jgi:3-hydroxyacyl-[acyl-carrier-protein] dehydratase
VVAHVALNPEHKIYKAHFPGQPITPGVCQIQMVTELLSLQLGAKVELTDIKNVKYMAVISPEETQEFDIRILKMAEADGVCKLMVVMEGTERVFSKMSLTYHVVRNNSDIQ